MARRGRRGGSGRNGGAGTSTNTISHGALSVKGWDAGWKTLADILGVPWDGKGGGDVLSQAAAVACADVLARDIGKAKFQLRRRLPNGGSEIIGPKDHWLARMFALDPNKYMTWVEFREMLVYHLAFLQTAYIIPLKDREGRAVELLPIQPARIRPEVDTNPGAERIVYRYFRGTALDDAMNGRLPELFFADEVIHVRTRAMDGLNAIPTTKVGEQVFALTKALTDFQDRLFGQETSARGVFTTENQIDTEKWEAIKADLKVSFEDFIKRNKPLFLDSGWEYKAVGMTSEQAQVAAAFDAQLEQACRLFNVPPHKIFHTKAVKYENLETIDRAYVTDTLVPICNRIEERMERGLLTEDERLEFFIEIDREALTLRDEKALAERVARLTERGVYHLDEARSLVGKNPTWGRKVYLIPSNMALVDGDTGEVILAASSKQPGSSDQSNPDQSGDTADAKKGVLRLVSDNGA